MLPNERLLRYKLLLEKEKQLRHGLPHKYAHKFYKFQVDFINDNVNKMQMLTAANQLGKSTTGIIKCLEWGFSDDEFRKKTWKCYNPATDKLLFFYLYPDEDTALREFKTKWLKYLPKTELLPEEMREQYQWSVNSGYKKNIEFLKEINQLSLRNCDIIFLTYGKNVLTIQASTAHAIFCDEELIATMYTELQMRLRATEGFFHMLFTATRGELIWYRAMECIGKPEETFPDARKVSVSLWDCQTYADGTPSMWTTERIRAEERKCMSHIEKLIRVDGRCLVDQDNLLIKHFKNDMVIQSFTLPETWELYAGIDIGSGGVNHKSSIAIVAVPPDRKSCVVLECWREDELPTTEDDVFRTYKEMVRKYNRQPVTFYDWHAKDFEKIMLNDNTVTMYKAEKSHEVGFGIINTLMKAHRVRFLEGSHMSKLLYEMKTCKASTIKTHRKDDAIDAFRYAIARIPFDFTDLQESIDLPSNLNIKVEEKKIRHGLAYRDGSYDDEEESTESHYAKEISEWNDINSF